MGSSGRRTHPVMPARAMDAPITFKKPRRETESTHSEAPLGNSRCSASWNVGLPASSSRLRQYSGPAFSFASLICARRESRSSLPFLVGHTSSLFSCSPVLIDSSIFIRISSMTGAATCNVLHIAHVVLLQQGRAQVDLIGETLSIHHHGVRARGLLVAHVEYLVARAQIFLRRAVAAQAPLHLQRFLLVHQRHLVDRTVAGIATHSFIDMNAVIEINEVRKLVYPRPLQRLASLVAGADGLEQLGIRPDLRVAVHASLGARNAGETRSLNGSVAVAAVDAESGDVMLMTEGHGLRLAHSRVGDVRRTLDLHRDPTERSNHEDRAENRGPGQSVGAAMKNLRHALSKSMIEMTRPLRRVRP